MNQYANPVTQAYSLEKVLIVMSPEDCETAQKLAIELALRGANVQAENDDISAAVLLEHNMYDVVITGIEFPHVAQYVRSKPAENRPLAVAVSTNGVKADVKLYDAGDLPAYAKSGLLEDHFRELRTLQAKKAEDDSPEMTDALLEIRLMDADAFGGR